MRDRSALFDADLFSPERLRRIGWAWVIAASIAATFHLWSETRAGLTNGHGIPLGEDFINFWSGAVLAANGQAHAVYDFAAFHKFQLAVAGAPLDLYHYSYPPVMLMISRPLAFFPYIAALVLWSLAGWGAMTFATRLVWPSSNAFLYTLAIPATFINLMDGQNGLWTAAILCAGLAWLPRRPIVSGVLFGLLLACKPQLALLLPLALLAERNWRALSAMIGSAIVLGAATVPLYGWNLWQAYNERVTVLRHVILENGNTWFYMPSAFIMVRHLPASVAAAYVVQGVVTLAAAALVAWIWSRRNQPQGTKNALLILCLLLASPYVQYYDLAIAALVPVMLLMDTHEGDPNRRAIFLVGAVLLAAPAICSFLAHSTGVALGWMLLLPGIWLALRQKSWTSDGAAPHFEDGIRGSTQ
jgi:hypothetical protein